MASIKPFCHGVEKVVIHFVTFHKNINDETANKRASKNGEPLYIEFSYYDFPQTYIESHDYVTGVRLEEILDYVIFSSECAIC